MTRQKFFAYNIARKTGRNVLYLFLKSFKFEAK